MSIKNHYWSEEEMELFHFFVLKRFLVQGLYFGWWIREGYTQGNETGDGNQIGFNDALWCLNYWKEHYGHLMQSTAGSAK